MVYPAEINSFFKYKNLEASLPSEISAWDSFTIRQLAHFAESSYDETNSTGKTINGWQTILAQRILPQEEDSKFSADFFAKVFISPSSSTQNREAIIAFSGLRNLNLGDIFLCAKFAGGYQREMIWKKVDRFIQKVLATLHENGISISADKGVINPRQIRVLGHSFGGSIAQIVGTHYKWPSLSFDGFGIKQLFFNSQESEEKLATTLAIIPNMINQLGSVFGKMIYILPNYEDPFDKEKILDYLESFLKTQHTSKEEAWWNTEEPRQLACDLVEKTVAFHAISNFTTPLSDRRSASVYREHVEGHMNAETWKSAQHRFISSLEEGVEKGLDHITQGPIAKGYTIGSNLGAGVGSTVASLGGRCIGTAGGFVQGTSEGMEKFALSGLLGGIALKSANLLSCFLLPGMEIINAGGKITTVAATFLGVIRGIQRGGVVAREVEPIGKAYGKLIGGRCGLILGTVVDLPNIIDAISEQGKKIAGQSVEISLYFIFFHVRPKIVATILR